jgi:hypothetical protein
LYVKKKKKGGDQGYDNIICNFHNVKIPGRKVTVLIIEKKEEKIVS